MKKCFIFVSKVIFYSEFIFYDSLKPKHPSAVNENNLESGWIKAATVEATMHTASLAWKKPKPTEQTKSIPHTTQRGYDNLLSDFQEEACQV